MVTVRDERSVSNGFKRGTLFLGAWEMERRTFSDPQFAGSLKRACGVFGEVFEDDGGGHCHGEGGVLVGLCFWWG